MFTPGPDIDIPNPPADGFPFITSTGAWDAAEDWLYFVDPTNFVGQLSSRIYRLNIDTGVAEIWMPFGALPQGCRAIEFNWDFTKFFIRDSITANLTQVLFADQSVTDLGDSGDFATPITQIVRVPASQTEFYAFSTNSRDLYKFSVSPGGAVTPISFFAYGAAYGTNIGLDQDGNIYRPIQRSGDGNDGPIIALDIQRLPLSPILGGIFHEDASDSADGPASDAKFRARSVMPNSGGSIVFFTSQGALKQILNGQVTTLGTAARILGFSALKNKLVTIHGGEFVNVWRNNE